MPKQAERPTHGLSESELHCILFVVLDGPLALNADQTHRLMEAFGWKSPNVARVMFNRAMGHLRANASTLTTPVVKRDTRGKDYAKPVGRKGGVKQESDEDDEDDESDESEDDSESSDAM